MIKVNPFEFARGLYKNIEIGRVRFNLSHSDMYIPNLSPEVVRSLKDIIEKHHSIVVDDNYISTIRVFTSRYKDEIFTHEIQNNVKFIGKLITNEKNILNFSQPQYLVTNPVYKIKKSLITVMDKSGEEQKYLNFFETHREELLRIINSDPIESSGRIIEFLEKLN